MMSIMAGVKGKGAIQTNNESYLNHDSLICNTKQALVSWHQSLACTFLSNGVDAMVAAGHNTNECMKRVCCSGCYAVQIRDLPKSTGFHCTYWYTLYTITSCKLCRIHDTFSRNFQCRNFLK